MINSKREMRAPGDESAASSSSPKKRLNFFQFKNYTKKKLLFVCTIVIESSKRTKSCKYYCIQNTFLLSTTKVSSL